MKGVKLAAMLGLLAWMKTAASAGDMDLANGVYMGFLGGASYPNKIDWVATNPLTGGTYMNAHLNYKIGGDVGAMLGYRCNSWRFEGELLYARNSFSKLQFSGYNFTIKSYLAPLAPTDTYFQNTSGSVYNINARLDGHSSLGAAFINGIYEFNNASWFSDSSWAPYVGLGLGHSRVTNNLKIYANYDTYIVNSVYLSPFSFPTIKATNNSWIVQFILGFNYYVDEYVTMGIDYRLLGIQSKNNNLQNITTISQNNSNSKMNGVNTINATITFLFDWNDE